MECPIEGCGYTGTPESVVGHITASASGDHRGEWGPNYREALHGGQGDGGMTVEHESDDPADVTTPDPWNSTENGHGEHDHAEDAEGEHGDPSTGGGAQSEDPATSTAVGESPEGASDDAYTDENDAEASVGGGVPREALYLAAAGLAAYAGWVFVVKPALATDDTEDDRADGDGQDTGAGEDTVTRESGGGLVRDVGGA